MDPAKYEYQSEFAKHYIALGRAEGEARGIAEGRSEGRSEGKVELITRQLTRRFGLLPATFRERLAAASPAELDRCAERLLDATSLDDVFDDR